MVHEVSSEACILKTVEALATTFFLVILPIFLQRELRSSFLGDFYSAAEKMP